MKLANKIEAIIYIKGRPLKIEEIFACLQQQVEPSKISPSDREIVEDGSIELMNDYAHRDSALEIVETEAGYSLQLKHEYDEHLLRELVPRNKVNDSDRGRIEIPDFLLKQY